MMNQTFEYEGFDLQVSAYYCADEPDVGIIGEWCIDSIDVTMLDTSAVIAEYGEAFAEAVVADGWEPNSDVIEDIMEALND